MELSNRQARHLWLYSNGLAKTPTGNLTSDDLRAIIRRLGFVQLDSIQIVARAHHHILWSRNQHYRPDMLDKLLADRTIFEHFTHDASILPIEFYPFWHRRFETMKMRVGDKGTWGKHLPSKFEIEKIRQRIEDEGPLCSRDFKGKGADKSVHPWMRPPHKLALDYLWYAGDLATHAREKFVKYYDLASRIIPDRYQAEKYTKKQQIDWLCREALSRLGMASEGDLQRFWDAVTRAEVRNWVSRNEKSLMQISVKAKDGSATSMIAPGNIDHVIGQMKSPTSRLRIINPFDPVLRDRARLERLFGYKYRIEIFIPAAKREYGYYVYPLLEGDRFVGRIEVKANRKNSTLNVINLWWENQIKATHKRVEKLNSELDRLARFVGVREIVWKTTPN